MLDKMETRVDRLEKFQQVLRNALEKTLPRLPRELAEQILESSEEFSLESTGHFAKHLQSLFARAGLIQGIIRFDGRPVFHWGPPYLFETGREGEIHTSESRLERLDMLSRIFEAESPGGRPSLEMEAIAPSVIRRLARKLVRTEILPLASLHYYNLPLMQDRRVVDTLRPVEDFIRNSFEEKKATGEGVVLTHFRFQGMDQYFEFMGDQVSRDVGNSIYQSIREYLKPSDRLYMISTRSYLGVSPGADPDALSRRFRSVYIMVRGLVIDFELIQYRILSEVDLSKIWKELKI